MVEEEGHEAEEERKPWVTIGISLVALILSVIALLIGADAQDKVEDKPNRGAVRVLSKESHRLDRRVTRLERKLKEVEKALPGGVEAEK